MLDTTDELVCTSTPELSHGSCMRTCCAELWDASPDISLHNHRFLYDY